MLLSNSNLILTSYRSLNLNYFLWPPGPVHSGPAHLTNPALCCSLSLTICQPLSCFSFLLLPTPWPWHMLFPLPGMIFFPSFSQLVSSRHLGLSLNITSSKRSLLHHSPLCRRIPVMLFPSLLFLPSLHMPQFMIMCVFAVEPL